MKKVLLGLVAAAAVPMMLSAQGTVSFSSGNANQAVRYSSNTTQGVGAGYVAALYWGTQGSTEAQLIQLGATTPVNNAAGGLLTTPATRTTGAGTAEGGVGTFQIRAWNDGFANYDAAIAGALATTQVGKTALFTNGTGSPNGTPPTTPSALSGWTSPLLVNFVPEPSSLALAGLGAVAMLVLRRRK